MLSTYLALLYASSVWATPAPDYHSGFRKGEALFSRNLIPRRMPTITCDGEVEIGPGTNLDTENPYFKGFINEDLQDDNTVNALKKDVFGKLNSLYHSDFAFTITCDGTTEACKEQAGKKYSYGHTDARTSTVNLCDDFFRQPSTEDMQNNCGDDRTLDEFETGAITPIHEYTHLKYIDEDQPWADHAYGSAQCVALARASDDCLINPDTMSLIACGTYYGDRCNKNIPLTPP